MVDELAEHGAVVVLGDDAPVEVLNIKWVLVGELLLLDSLDRAIENEHLLASIVVNAIVREDWS